MNNTVLRWGGFGTGASQSPPLVVADARRRCFLKKRMGTFEFRKSFKLHGPRLNNSQHIVNNFEQTFENIYWLLDRAYWTPLPTQIPISSIRNTSRVPPNQPFKPTIRSLSPDKLWVSFSLSKGNPCKFLCIP